ncbi:hypothetical protein B0H14DRAFT_2639982 [Mycena olivaceomarginata]|nr:hypothetical protein B0H14DRAFT_2639982 [Mycena olivaceomarginata]
MLHNDGVQISFSSAPPHYSRAYLLILMFKRNITCSFTPPTTERKKLEIEKTKVEANADPHGRARFCLMDSEEWERITETQRITEGASGPPPPTRPRARAYYAPQLARTGCDTYSGHHKQTLLWPAMLAPSRSRKSQDRTGAVQENATQNSADPDGSGGRYLGATAAQDWIGLDTSTAPGGTRRGWVPFHCPKIDEDANVNVVRRVVLRSGLGVQLQRLGDGYPRYETRTRQDKTGQDSSMEVDAEPKPNPGGELVVCACCANAGIKVKVKMQP